MHSINHINLKGFGEKEAIFRDYIVYDSIYLTFSKSQSYNGNKHLAKLMGRRMVSL